jgi:hypothetical protein
MRQKIIAAIFTFVLLAVLPTCVSFCLAQYRLGSASDQDSGTPGRTPGASDSSSSQLSEGCKLGTYTGTTPLRDVQDHFPGEEDLRGGMTCVLRVNSHLSLFAFHFAGQADNSLGDIDITEGDSVDVIQTIDYMIDPSAMVPRTAAQSVLSPIDADFDGYQDLQLLSSCGATGNCSYDFYLYDPKKRKFVHNDFLSGLVSPSFDQAKKQVTTSSNSSVSDWQSETYQYVDGRYTLIHREVSTWNREKHMVTVNTYELRNGKMELVDSTTKPE